MCANTPSAIFAKSRLHTLHTAWIYFLIQKVLTWGKTILSISESSVFPGLVDAVCNLNGLVSAEVQLHLSNQCCSISNSSEMSPYYMKQRKPGLRWLLFLAWSGQKRQVCCTSDAIAASTVSIMDSQIPT